MFVVYCSVRQCDMSKKNDCLKTEYRPKVTTLFRKKKWSYKVQSEMEFVLLVKEAMFCELH